MKPILTRNRVIGLLGGSFNPAHSGHLHITLYALNKLGLDAVWWLVSPRNPLKDAGSLAAYEERLISARKVAAASPRIHVSDIERRLRKNYSFQTIRTLKKRYRGAHFVWLMGADHPPIFHRWRRWKQVYAELPVVVFDRAPYSHAVQRSRAAAYARKFTRQMNQIARFDQAPSFHYIHLKRDPISSTSLRKELGKDAFLAHNEGVRAKGRTA